MFKNEKEKNKGKFTLKFIIYLMDMPDETKERDFANHSAEALLADSGVKYNLATSNIPSTTWGARDGRDSVLNLADIEEDERIFSLHISGTGINFDKYSDIKVDLSEDIPPMTSFYHIKVDASIQNNIKRLGFVNPTPVQKYAIPCGL